MSTSEKLLGLKRNKVVDEVMELFFKKKHKNYLVSKLFYSKIGSSIQIINKVTLLEKIKSKHLLEYIFEFLQSSDIKLIHNQIINKRVRYCTKNAYLKKIYNFKVDDIKEIKPWQVRMNSKKSCYKKFNLKIFDLYLMNANLPIPFTEIRDFLYIDDYYYVLTSLTKIHKIKDNKSHCVFELNSGFIYRIKYFDNYKGGKKIAALLMNSTIIISLNGEVIEYFKNSFMELINYPYDRLIGINEDNSLISNPTKYILPINPKHKHAHLFDNPEENIKSTSRDTKPHRIIEQESEFEFNLIQTMSVGLSDNLMIRDLSYYDNNIVLIFSENKLALINIKEYHVEELRNADNLKNVIIINDLIICQDVNIIIYTLKDLKIVNIINGNFLVCEMSCICKKLLGLYNKESENIYFYDLSENKLVENNLVLGLKPQHVSIIKTDMNSFNLGVIDSFINIKMFSCSI